MVRGTLYDYVCIVGVPNSPVAAPSNLAGDKHQPLLGGFINQIGKDE